MRLRFLRFNVVSALGIGVRLVTVAILASGLGLHYLVATAAAIEVSILHNFIWHLRWTWASAGNGAGATPPAAINHVYFRCLAFHASNGLVSLVGAMVMMPMLVGRLKMHYLLANLITVCLTGLLNFFCGDRLIFRPTGASR
jgi:putative flippase GtrA